MTRAACGFVVLCGALVLAGCGLLEPKERILPAGFAEPRFLLISDEAQGPILVGGDYGLRTSLDGGRTWTTPEGGDAPALAAGPYATRILISNGPTRQSFGYALDAAPDAAESWPFGGSVTAMTGTARRERLWAVSGARDRPVLHYSNDAGQTWWTMPAIGLCPRPRALAAGPPSAGRAERLWVACGRQGLVVSDDLGVNFRRVGGITRADDVAAARSAEGHVVVATPQVAVTRDGGASWRYAALYAERVAVDPRKSDLVFAVGRNGVLHPSLDGGLTF